MLRANYFDGRSTRVCEVSLTLAGDDLIVTGDAIERHIPFARVGVDEHLGSAPRCLRFDDGTFCEIRDLGALDQFLATTRHRDSLVDRMQRHLLPVLLSLLAFVALLFAAYRYGLPWAAEQGARRMPASISHTLSVQTLKALDRSWLQPTRLALDRRNALLARFHALQLPGGGAPESALLFRRSDALGANAFTLPDGTVVLLDDLVTILKSDDQVVAVVSHELGHAALHHGLQRLLETSAIGTFLALYIGDISQLIAMAPAALLNAHYSQDLERQADDYGAALLLKNHLSPGLLADALQAVAAAHPDSPAGYLSSHPATKWRMEHLRSLAATAK